jgi:hypothetical protein
MVPLVNSRRSDVRHNETKIALAIYQGVSPIFTRWIAEEPSLVAASQLLRGIGKGNSRRHGSGPHSGHSMVVGMSLAVR